MKELPFYAVALNCCFQGCRSFVPAESSNLVPPLKSISPMDLHQKIRTLPTDPGVYLYKNAEGEVIYVGKAKSLRARVRSYFLEAAQS